MELTSQQCDFFETFGFLRLEGLVKDSIQEITDAFEEVWRSHGGGHHGQLHTGEKRSCMVPFIDQHTRLCALLDDERIMRVARCLLGDDFNYCASDGNYYTGDTLWHSKPFFGGVKALKFAFYLDPLDADTGCLRVVPGSHMFGDAYADRLDRSLERTRDLWGIDPSKVPAVALHTRPGDVIVFNHCIKHGSYGGGKQRRLFVINCSQRFPEEQLAALRKMIAGMARFWRDSFYGDIMVNTADAKRMVHLEQVLANQDHLPELATQARLSMAEPSRG